MNYEETRGDFGSIVDVAWLADQLGRKHIVVADCRFDLADPEAGRRAYDQDHIPGAVYFDLEQDLSYLPGESTNGDFQKSGDGEGGRHPLPPVDKMAQLFGAAGIDDRVTVVCYDDQKGAMAARLWWMLRYTGHARVALLNGGYSAWLQAGHPVTSEKSKPITRTFVPRPQHHMIATMKEVRDLAGSDRGIIIDSRAPRRFLGEIEPLDPVAGHIPGAINMPWEGNIDDNGAFLDDGELAKRFKRTSDHVIVHCGSGVTGCVNVLAMERAGLKGVKLYVGGWSEWCSHPENPVATGADSTD